MNQIERLQPSKTLRKNTIRKSISLPSCEQCRPFLQFTPFISFDDLRKTLRLFLWYKKMCSRLLSYVGIHFMKWTINVLHKQRLCCCHCNSWNFSGLIMLEAKKSYQCMFLQFKMNTKHRKFNQEFSAAMFDFENIFMVLYIYLTNFCKKVIMRRVQCDVQ